MLKKTIETIIEFVMVLLVIMVIRLVLMETVMVPIGGLLKPINPNGMCPKTHYRKPFL